MDDNQITMSSLDVSYLDVTEIKIALFNTQSEFKFELFHNLCSYYHCSHRNGVLLLFVLKKKKWFAIPASSLQGAAIC